MATEGIVITGQIVSSIIGKDLVTKAITDSANSIYKLIYGIVDYKDLSIESFIYELDIQNKINIVELLISQIEEHNLSKLVMTSLTGLHDIILNIREDLKQISIIINCHRDKYFNSWRSMDTSVQIKQLSRHVTILNSRLDMLMKILSIPHHYQYNTKIKSA
jgi:hypothetical protein